MQIPGGWNISLKLQYSIYRLVAYCTAGANHLRVTISRQVCQIYYTTQLVRNRPSQSCIIEVSLLKISPLGCVLWDGTSQRLAAINVKIKQVSPLANRLWKCTCQSYSGSLERHKTNCED